MVDHRRKMDESKCTAGCGIASRTPFRGLRVWRRRQMGTPRGRCLILLALAVCITACRQAPSTQAPVATVPGTSVLFPRQPPVQGERITMTALLVGTLVEVEGCLRVNVEDHTSYLPVWPPDFTSRIRDGRIEIIDRSGQVAARVGDVAEMGGGEDQTGSSLNDELRRALAGRCAGPYWIVGRTVRRVDLSGE